MMEDEEEDSLFDIAIYHSPCPDGSGAAFVVDLAHTSTRPIDLLGLENGPFPVDAYRIVSGRRVIMIDISFSREEMINLNNICKKFVVLDHHKTAEETLRGLSFAQFDMNRSGCQMAWDYFFTGKVRPAFLDYIGLRDLWRHKDNEKALYFTTAMKERGLSLVTYYEYYESPELVQSMIDRGRSLIESDRIRIEAIASTATVVKYWHGYRTHIVTTGLNYSLLSDVGNYISTENQGDVVLLYKTLPEKDGVSFRYSLRSYNGVGGPDTTEISRKYGGGGHEHASGFTCQLNLQKLLEDGVYVL